MNDAGCDKFKIAPVTDVSDCAVWAVSCYICGFVQFLLPEFTNMGMALPTLVGLPVVLSIVAVTLIGIVVTGIVWWRRHSWLQNWWFSDACR